MSQLRVTTLNNASNTGTANLTLDDAGNATVGNTLVMGSSFKRNFLINGDMRVAQRATSYNNTTSIVYGLVDRFAFFQATSAASTASQVAANLANFQYAVKLQRNASSTTTGAIGLIQVLETANSIPLQGLPVTISLYAKAGANFSGSNLRIFVGTGTGTDQGAASFGGWTGALFPVNTTQALTTTWARYSFTGTISASATQVGIQIDYIPTGTAGADDSVHITGVQLETGTIATPYERQIYSNQLIECCRYYQKASGLLTSSSGTNAVSALVFKVEMRATPTASLSGVMSITQVGVSDYTQSSATVTQLGSTWTQYGGSFTFQNFPTLPSNAALPQINTATLNLSAEL